MKKSLGAKPLLNPTPVLIVGTYDDAEKPNAMAVAWGGICCSKPPCVAVSLRKATYSYSSIVDRNPKDWDAATLKKAQSHTGDWMEFEYELAELRTEYLMNQMFAE